MPSTEPPAPSPESVKVVVRCRPFNTKETERGCKRCVTVDKQRAEILLINPNSDEPPKPFPFDGVYDVDSTQTQVYNETARPIVSSVLEGYNGTVFAYGQTGAGKTFTMEGVDKDGLQGLIPNSFKHIFDAIEKAGDDKTFIVTSSMLEIYNEEIRDLLGKNPKAKLDLKETNDKGVYVKGLTNYVVKSAKEMANIMRVGKKNRSVGTTQMNMESSRSHCIFVIYVESFEKSTVDDTTYNRGGKLNMVDLAGSERQTKTQATGDQLKEGCKINWSLSALGNVIFALIDPKNRHIPYRDSKLTRLLQDSLGGNTKTVMVANCSPADYNYEETLSTLRYATRAKKIKNKPKINEDPKEAMIKNLQQQIGKLQEVLKKKEMQVQNSMQISMEQALQQLKEDQKKREQELREQIIREREEMEKKDKKFIEKEASEKKLSEEEERELASKREAERKAEEEAKLKALEEQKKKLEEEFKSKAQELKKKAEDEKERERMEKRNLEKKLAEMAAQVIHGKTRLLEKNKEHEKEIERQKKEMERQREEEMRLRRELQEKEEEKFTVEKQYASLQEEIDIKTKKLKKLWNKYQICKSEIDDIQREFQQEREDYLYTIRQYERELKLKQKIIDHFIPPEEAEKITKRAAWNEEEEDWKIKHIFLAGNGTKPKRPQSAVGLKRPVSDYARIASAMGNQNPRYKMDNIITLDLEMPERTTQDYDPSRSIGDDFSERSSSSMSQAEFMASETIPNVYYTYGTSTTKKTPSSGKRPKTAGKKKVSNSIEAPKTKSSEQNYPSARGLVKSDKRFA